MDIDCTLRPPVFTPVQVKKCKIRNPHVEYLSTGKDWAIFFLCKTCYKANKKPTIKSSGDRNQ